MSKIKSRHTVHLILAAALLFGMIGLSAPLQAQAQVQAGPGEQIYVVQPGDNLTRIAIRFNTTVAALLQRNPQIVNPSLIFTGQRLVVPAPPVTPTPVIPDTGVEEQIYIVRQGDTLRSIAARFGTTVADLLQRNPAIFNPNLIFVGQRLVVPATPVLPVPPPTPTPPPPSIPDTGEQIYIVRQGDTLRSIAARFGTTVADLLQRNPAIFNPNLIFVGQRLVVPATPVVPTPPATPPPTPTPPGPTPTPSVPLHPDTARQVISEDFSVPNIWFTDIDPNWRIEYVDGRYRIVNFFLNAYVNSVRSFNFPNVHAEVDTNQVAGPSSGYWGVVCRWQNINNFYAMVIGGNGSTGIVRVQNSFVTFLNQGTADFNTQGWNRVGANCDGNTLTLYLNGQAVLQATDNTFTSGFPGVMVGTRTGSGVDVHFDNFTAYIR